MNRLIPRLLFVVLMGVIVAGYFGWKTYAARRAWASIRPSAPALVGAAAPGLDARLTACAERLNHWPPDVSALAEFARVCHANGQLDAAIAGYQALIALSPAEPRSPYRLASILAGY